MGVFERALPAPRIDLAEEAEFDLGGMHVIPAERAVVLDGDRRELQPRVMKVLIALAKASPAVVSRDKLVEQCWDGRIVGDDAVNRCILALRHLAQQSEQRPFTIETVPRIGHRLVGGSAAGDAATKGRLTWKPVMATMLVLAVAVAVLIATLRSAGSAAPTVIVAAASDSPASRELAADLTLKLGRLNTALPSSLRLLGDAGGPIPKADLLLEVGRLTAPATPGASLVIKSGSDQSILWSEELKQRGGSLPDLKQQTAFVAARVLGCAAEALDRNGEQLSQQTLKRYLNGCAALADLVGRGAESVIPIFRGVVRDAPRFEGAWAKLLFADTDVFVETETIQDRNRLQADLAAARKVNPDLPEIYLAQIALLPGSEIAEKMRLVTRALELAPEHSGARATRSSLLQLVGRMKDSIVDARLAMELDPLSPMARGNFAYALAAAGHYDAALRELEIAERLWPGSSNVADTRFAIHLRYGDPRQAGDYLRDHPSKDWMNAESYLEARANRSPRNVELAIQEAETLYRRSPRTLQHLIQVYGEFGRHDRLLEVLEKAPEAGVIHLIDLTFRAPTADFWLNPRALRVAKRSGLLDYWRRSGQWPDFCFRPDLPYDCNEAAATIAG